MAQSSTLNTTDVALGSDEVDSISCDSCGTDGSDIPAEGYCETCTEYLCRPCYDFHCKPRPTRHHVLVDKTSMPKSKSRAAEEDIGIETCLKHPTMPLKIYCKLHNELGCLLCLSESHKTCTNVSFIHDCAKGVESTIEFQDIYFEVLSLKMSFKMQLDDANRNMKSNDNSTGKVNTSEILSLLKGVVEDVSKIDSMQKDMHSKSCKVTTECDQTLRQLDKFSNNRVSESKMFINMKRGKAMLTQAKSCLEKVQKDNEALVVFGSQNLEGLQRCRSVLKNVLSSLETEDEESPIAQPASMSDESVSDGEYVDKVVDLVNMSMVELYIRKYSDDKECRITGSTVLTCGDVALCDFNNKSVKVVPDPREDYNQYICIVPLDIDGCPFDIIEVKPGLLAVTVPERRQIIMITYDDGVLFKDEVIYTDDGCYGIASAGKLLYATVSKPPKVVVMNAHGDVLDTFNTDDNGISLFASPWYLALDRIKGRIYVTDRNFDDLTCLDMKGNKLKAFNDSRMKRPYGVVVDSYGMIYVCSRDSNTLFCLDEDFEIVKVIEDDSYLRKIESIAAWNEPCQLYMGLYQDNYLTVMDLQRVRDIHDEC